MADFAAEELPLPCLW